MAKKPKGVTVDVKEPRPKRPKVDSGAAFETLTRQMFKHRVELWCKENMEQMPDKESLGSVVDNLTASWTSALECTVDAATDTYLATFTDEDVDEVECPECKEEFEVPEDADEGDEVKCPECQHKFELPAIEDEDDEDEDDVADG